MADSIKASKSLSIGIEYEGDDGKKTTTIKLPNYQDGLTEQRIKDVFANQEVIMYGVNEQGIPQFLTSDNIYTASTTNETINNLDIGWED